MLSPNGLVAALLTTSTSLSSRSLSHSLYSIDLGLEPVCRLPILSQWQTNPPQGERKNITAPPPSSSLLTHAISISKQTRYLTTTSTVTAQTNPRGIPVAPFVDNVAEYVASREDVEPTLRRFQEMISKYQFMEVNAQRRAVGLRDKTPDIKKTLEMVRFLKMRREVCYHLLTQHSRVGIPDTDNGWKSTESNLDTSFELNDTLYARASISPADTEEVYLWLGANVMLAYPIGEAEEMLQEKLSAAQLSLSNCEEDQEFLREQITVCPCPRLFFSLCVFVAFIDDYRPWRLRLLVCTTGMLCSGGKIRQMGKVMITLRSRVVKSVYYRRKLRSIYLVAFLLYVHFMHGRSR